MKKTVGILFILLALAFSFHTLPASSQQKQYRIAHYDVHMSLTEEGDYIVTERITFHFEQGLFSSAHREVPGRGFTSLRFISVEGVNHPVSTVQATDGRRLSAEWTYPETSGETTFLIMYEAMGGLRSRNGQNIIDWNPVGSEWDVPIDNVTVTVTLPENVGTIDVDPASDVVERGGDFVTLQYDNLPPRTHYHVVITFPEIVTVPTRPPVYPWVIGGFVAGLATIFASWRRVTPLSTKGKSPHRPSIDHKAALPFLHMAVVLSPGQSHKIRRGIASHIFDYAQSGYIQLVADTKRRWSGQHAVTVEMTGNMPQDRHGIRRPQSDIMIQQLLEKHRRLDRVARDTTGIHRILRKAADETVESGLISGQHRSAQNRRFIVGSFAVIGGAAVAMGFALWPHLPVLLTLGSAVALFGVGQWIAGATIDVRTPEGIAWAARLKDRADAAVQDVNDTAKTDPTEAWQRFFDTLPYIVLSDKLTASKIKSWEKQFARSSAPPPPRWISLGVKGSKQTLDALTVADMMKYTFIVIVATSSSVSPSASGMGAGASGSGAGGGGGGAG